jgi:hypothetical protein
MSTELRQRNQSQQLYVRALSSAYRAGTQLHDPSMWLLRDPEAEEKMFRDADIRHAVGYRRHLISGRGWSVAPKQEGSPRAAMSTHVATELLKNIKHFTQARMNLARAFFSGARFARIHGTWKTLTIGDGRARKWWVPIRLEDMDKRMYRQVMDSTDGQDLAGHWERWNLGKQEFVPETRKDVRHTIRHIYQDDQAALGHGSALREAVGWWWYAKTHVFQESLQAVERFAQGILAAKIDGARDAATGAPNEQLIADWVAMLEDMRSRHVMVFDKSDEVEIISGNAEGYQLLESIRAELRNTIYTLIMGANLTTAAAEGGSYALAEVQENSTEALVQFDRETLQETLSDDLLGCVWFNNWANLVELGIEMERPNFSIDQEKMTNPLERAQVAEIANRMGIDLGLEDVMDQIGFQVPDSGEAIIKGGAPAPDSGFGGDPFSQGAALFQRMTNKQRSEFLKHIRSEAA